MSLGFLLEFAVYIVAGLLGYDMRDSEAEPASRGYWIALGVVAVLTAAAIIGMMLYERAHSYP